MNRWIVTPDADLADLIPTFIQNRKKDLVQLEQSIARADFDAIRRLGHTLKGICRPYGFIDLEAMSKALEGAAEAGDLEAIKGLYKDMKDYVEHVEIRYE